MMIDVETNAKGTITLRTKEIDCLWMRYGCFYVNIAGISYAVTEKEYNRIKQKINEIEMIESGIFCSYNDTVSYG